LGTEMHCLCAIKKLYSLTLLLRFRIFCNVGKVDVIALDRRKNWFLSKQTCHFWCCSFERLFTRCGETACSCIFFSASCGKCINNNVSVKSWMFVIKTLQRCICKYDIFNVSKIDLTWANEEKRMAQNTTSTYNLFNVEQSSSRTNIYINIPQSDKNKFISRNHKPVSKVSTYHNKRLGNSITCTSNGILKGSFRMMT